jgi:hypothetical protein
VKKVNKSLIYVGVWALMVSATLLELHIFTASFSATGKTVAILALAIAQAFANAAIFQNLGYERKIVALLPIIALLVLQTLLVTAVLSVGM